MKESRYGTIYLGERRREIDTTEGRLLLLRITYVKHNRKARNLTPRTRARLRKEIREAMRHL